MRHLISISCFYAEHHLLLDDIQIVSCPSSLGMGNVSAPPTYYAFIIQTTSRSFWFFVVALQHHFSQNRAVCYGALLCSKWINHTSRVFHDTAGEASSRRKRTVLLVQWTFARKLLAWKSRLSWEKCLGQGGKGNFPWAHRVKHQFLL